MSTRTINLGAGDRSALGVSIQQAPGSAPMAVSQRLWGQGGNMFLTIIVKTTFALQHHETARLLEPTPFPTALPVPAADSALAPFLPSAGVTVVGHARAPAGTMVRRTHVRLRVRGATDAPSILDKSLVVVGDRASADAFPDVFQEIPLSDDFAYGGPELEDNPVGVGAGPQSGSQPNVLPSDQSNAFASLGPVARSRPARKSLLGRTDLATIDALLSLFTDEFDWRYFHVAPVDQQIPYLVGDEWIVLDGFDASAPEIESRMPGIVPRVLVRRGSARTEEWLFRADHLEIDADTKTCSLYFRAHHSIQADALSEYEAVLATASQSAPVEWPVGWIAPRGGATDSGVIANGNGRAAKAAGMRSTIQLNPAEAMSTAQAAPPWIAASESKPSSRGRAPQPPAPPPPPAQPPPPAPIPPTPIPPAPIPPASPRSVPRPPPALQSAQLPPAPLPLPLDPTMPHASAPPATPMPPALGPNIMGLRPVVFGPPPPRGPLPSFMIAAREAVRAGSDPDLQMPPSSSSTFQVSETADAPEPPSEVARSERPPREPELAAERSPSVPPPDEPRATTTALGQRSTSATAPLSRDATARRTEIIARMARGESLQGADLSGFNLSTLDFEGRSLRGANLSGARLEGAKLAEVDLSHALLDDADLTDADLSGASLERASLHRAILIRTDLRRAKLADGDFTGAEARGAKLRAASGAGVIFRNASLVDCDLSDVQLERVDLGSSRLQSTSFANAKLVRARFDEATLLRVNLDAAQITMSRWWGANLDDCSLREVGGAHSLFHGAVVRRSRLHKAELSEACFRNAKLDDVDFAQAQLRNSDWQDASFSSTRFRKADLTGSTFRQIVGTIDFEEAKLEGADFTSAKLERASFVAARMRSVRADGALLASADLSRADLSSARFRNATLTQADLSLAIIAHTDFSDADLREAFLFRVDQSRARFIRTRLDGIDVKTDRRKPKAVG